MSRPLRTTLATVSVLALAAVPALAADAPVVGRQQTWTGATSPVSVPGNHLHRGDRIPKGARLVSRVVSSTGGTARRRVVLTLPKGKRLTGIAVSESTAMSIQVPKSQRHYVGHRRVTILAIARKGHTGDLTVYAYGR